VEAKGLTISTLSGTPRYYTFRAIGLIRGQCVTSLIDGGVTHNFIDATLLAKRHMATEDFEGFNVVVVDGFNLTCTQKILRLAMTFGNYTLTGDFCMVDLAGTSIVLGVQ